MTASTLALSYAKTAKNKALDITRSAPSFVKKHPGTVAKYMVGTVAVGAPILAPAGIVLTFGWAAGWGFKKASKFMNDDNDDNDDTNDVAAIGSIFLGLVSTVFAIAALAVCLHAKGVAKNLASADTDASVTQKVAEGDRASLIQVCEPYRYFKAPFLSHKKGTSQVCSTGNWMATSGGYAMYKLDGNVTTVQLNAPKP